MRERLSLPAYDPVQAGGKTISLAKAAERLGISITSARSLASSGILPASQLMPGAQWLVRADALTSEAVRIGVQRVINRRPKNYEENQENRTIRLPGL